MSKGTVQVFFGEGAGKSMAAIGKGIREIASQKTVIMVQFLKGSHVAGEEAVLKKLEPDMKVFRFEKSAIPYESLDPQMQQEEKMNIRNGINYAKKVISTRECDVLILDEILGLLELGMLPEEEFIKLIESRDEDMELVLTGRIFPESLHFLADSISCIHKVTVDK
ncbi:MAG: cob(I)yrinic acid a,c-diamide adenosyltransferase [bacterium]|nr:cob(I)yrinic acid a,c-diamide adenosyltransferase [bacterium]